MESCAKPFESLDKALQDVALSLQDQGLWSELRKEFGWDDRTILDKIAIQLRTNNSSDYFFFLHSINQALRFIGKLVSFFPKIKADYDHFKMENKFVAEVRNIYEHFEEYVVGKGYNRDKNYVFDKMKRSLSDATGISGFVDDKTGEFDLVIGNRVSVRTAVQSAKNILTCILMIREESRQC